MECWIVGKCHKKEPIILGIGHSCMLPNTMWHTDLCICVYGLGVGGEPRDV